MERHIWLVWLAKLCRGHFFFWPLEGKLVCSFLERRPPMCLYRCADKPRGREPLAQGQHTCIIRIENTSRFGGAREPCVHFRPQMGLALSLVPHDGLGPFPPGPSWVFRFSRHPPRAPPSFKIRPGKTYLAGKPGILPRPRRFSRSCRESDPLSVCVVEGESSMCSLLTRPRRASFPSSMRSALLFLGRPDRERSQSNRTRVFGMALRLLVAVGAIATAQGALELDMDNWNSALAGKSAFVKFLAPW